MADVELVIKIPEDVFKRTAFYHELRYLNDYITIVKALEKATPLPKGHGRLIDADALRKDDEVTEWLSINPIRTGKNLKMFSELFVKKIDDTPTIIDAESEDKK